MESSKIENSRTKPRKKTGGRKAGTPNIVDHDYGNFLKAFIAKIEGDILPAWKKLTPFQQMTTYKDLMRYQLPVKAAIEHTEIYERLEEDQLDKIIESMKAELAQKHKSNGEPK